MTANLISVLNTQINEVVAPARRAIEKVGELNARRGAPLILELDLTEPLVEGSPSDPLAAVIQRRRTRLKEVLDGLRKAADDERVSALVAKVGLARMGFARAQELRDAVAAFRASGKPAIAWAETFGEWSNGTVPYYLATAFDEIWLQPIGDVTLNGLLLGTPFLRNALDRIDVEPEFGQRYEYKNAADVVQRASFSDAHREAIERIASSVFDQLAGDIARARGLQAAQVRELADRAPLSSEQALAAGLIDRVGYRDEVYAEVRRRAGTPERLQYVARYIQRARRRPTIARPRHTIALVWGVGSIVQGRSGRRGPGGTRMGADTVTAALRAAARDQRVEAILFRVDSPGGSAVASDAIWREVLLASRAGKPVVVSMGDIAASGGYYVSMAADVIVAEPSTITGSIGVLAGKLVTDKLWNRLGVTYDSVAIGELARMFSTRAPYSDAERAALESWLDRIYEEFVGKVASGRRMSPEQVHAVAKGRVWTGADAREHGLVDVLGGLDRAVHEARRAAGIPAGEHAALVTYPNVPPVARLLPPQSSESPGAADAAGTLNGWDAFAGIATRLGLPAAGPLSLPWVPAWM